MTHRQSCTQWGLASMTLQGQQLYPPQCLHLQCILNDQGRTFLAYLLRNMSLSKQARRRRPYNSRILGGEVFLLCTRWQSKMFVVLKSLKKDTHKWNIKRHYDTVLCSKSPADAANLSIFSLRHVLCGLRCLTRRNREATFSTWFPMPDVHNCPPLWSKW